MMSRNIPECFEMDIEDFIVAAKLEKLKMAQSINRMHIFGVDIF